MARIGYARVSTHDQCLDLQRDALRATRCDRVFEDEGVSGAEVKRPGLAKALRALNRGDTLVVWRLDRLGRSITHLIQVVAGLHSRGVEFQSLTEGIDTNSAGGRLVFHIMAAIAEFERSLISERTTAGIAAARARGQPHGRRPSMTVEQCEEAYRAIRKGECSEAEVAIRYKIHRRTLRRRLDGLARITGTAAG
ncbi:DNA invertase Pin-like site-specific DNA recombinase [Rhizobium sp. PP-CC-2G-626]|nr:DNA invertase Pin-like site-specific DNA recombinase [Rhizobium sp. PP-CC-2G-626]